MEPVTDYENVVLRGMSIQGINKRKTHCKWGHEFTPENTYRQIRKGRDMGRGCLACRRTPGYAKGRP